VICRSNFLYREQIPVEHQRPERTLKPTQAAFDEIVARIGMTPTAASTTNSLPVDVPPSATRAEFADLARGAT
jgi:hypothetical protein